MQPQDILDFIKDSPIPQTKRDIAKAFGIKGGELRIVLKKILKALVADGAIVKQAGGAYSVPSGLPHVTVIEVHDMDIDGDLYAKPAEWNEELQGPPPPIVLSPDRRPAKIGDRILARLSRQGDGVYKAKTIKRLDDPRGQVMGLLRIHKNGNGILSPANKKSKYEFEIPAGDTGDARDGDLVVGEIQPARGLKRKKARVVEILGCSDDPKAISLISMHEVGLSERFPDAVLKATKGMSVPPLKGREDLRDIPLVTIDGADARDFDDAVFAEKTEEGYHLIVAIADVSHYVTHGSALDNEAQKRGNSTYFPDRVVPMLPEALSNDLCSLVPDEDRACLAAHLWIDPKGKLIRYKFVRGLMRSHARLIYEQVQQAYEEQHSELMPILGPLYDVFAILDAARMHRGALDLDLPERKIIIDEKGNMSGVSKRLRLDSHKLIEEFMILANVAAARALEDKGAPCVYRVHDKPGSDKLDSAREFVDSFGLSLPKGQVIKPKQLNTILTKAKTLPYSHLISEVILRCQSQAVYDTDNLGHYGLALSKYAHFTSPIRRYADLLVHRSLVSAYKLGKGGMNIEEEARLEEICDHISNTERTSMSAERAATDRFTASFLSTQINAEFVGRISGVSRFGLFVLLEESGADGIVPMRSLPDDFYIHDETLHALIGRRHGRIYQMGANVTVRLLEADGITGSTVLELVGHDKGATIPGAPLPKRPAGNRHDRRGRGRDDKPRGRGAKHKKSLHKGKRRDKT